MDSSFSNYPSSPQPIDPETEFFDFTDFSMDFPIQGQVPLSPGNVPFSPVENNTISTSVANQVHNSFDLPFIFSENSSFVSTNPNSYINSSNNLSNKTFYQYGNTNTIFNPKNTAFSLEPMNNNNKDIPSINSNLTSKNIQETFQQNLQKLHTINNTSINTNNSKSNITNSSHTSAHHHDNESEEDDADYSSEESYEYAHDHDNENSQRRLTRPQKKRKIQSRVKKACLACRRSHVGCDAVRPCKRCLKKGIPCIDTEESEVAYAFNNTLPQKRRSEREPEVLNENEVTSYTSNLSPVTHQSGDAENSIVPSSQFQTSNQNDTGDLKQLKKIVQNQQQMLTMLMTQLQMQTHELNELKMHLEIQPRIHCTLFHSVPHGPWNNFSESKDQGIFVFRNDDSQQLLGFNSAMARWKQIDEVDLKVGGWNWWKMSERQILPKPILCLVKSGHRSLYFNFKVLTKYNMESEVRVSIHVEDQVWWLVIDFSLCGSEPHHVTCLPDQNCPLKRERIEKECKDEMKRGFPESMNILLGSPNNTIETPTTPNNNNV